MTAGGPSAAATRYNEVAVHFDVKALPTLLERYLPSGPLALADLGCGDGPHFAVLERLGHIGPSRPVYAVDLEEARLRRVRARWPFVQTVVAPADQIPHIANGSLEFVISTMVMEHVPDERRYLDEIGRILRPGGRAYITTVFKRRWAWYFRRNREGESVLDPTHLREYLDLGAFKDLVMEEGRFIQLLDITLEPLWFPLLDPILFRTVGARGRVGKPGVVRLLRKPKVPIPGYYSLQIVLER